MPYHRSPKRVNLIVHQEREEIQEDMEIPYYFANPTQLNFWEFFSGNELEKHVSAEQIGNFCSMLELHGGVFSSDPGNTHLVEMDITLNDGSPVRTKLYRMSTKETVIVREQIRRLLELGMIEVSQSDCASPMILMENPRKDPFPCVDYRKLKVRERNFPPP